MSNYATKKLKEIVEIITDGDWIESKDQSEKGIRLIQTGNIGEGIYLEKEKNAKYISEETFKRLKCTEVLTGDILVSRLPTPVGRACILPKSNKRMITAVDCTIIRTLQSILLPNFFIFFSQSSKYRQQVERHLFGSTRIRISRKNLESLEIPIPPVEVQAEIVKVLSNVSDLLALRKQQLKQLNELVESLFYEMFGDPVDNEKRWEIKKLSQIGSLDRGISKHRPRNDPRLLGGEHPLIQTGDVANADFIIRNFKQTYSDIGLKQSKMWVQGTLCITIAANIAKTALLGFNSCFPDSIVGFNSNAQTNNIFIHVWFSFFQKIIESQAPESAQKNINLRILSDLNVISPPIELQNDFSDLVIKVEEQKEIVKQSIKEIEHLFDSLMNQYFE